MKSRCSMVWLMVMVAVLVVGPGCGGDEDESPGGTGDVSLSDTGQDDAGLDSNGNDVGAEPDVGGEDDVGAVPPTYDMVWQALNSAHSCGNGYCHGGGSSPNIASYDLLVNQESDCDQSVRVVPGDPEASLLWRKIAPQIAAEDVCGDKMAPSDPVSPELAQMVYDWIADGAPRE